MWDHFCSTLSSHLIWFPQPFRHRPFDSWWGGYILSYHQFSEFLKEISSALIFFLHVRRPDYLFRPLHSYMVVHGPLSRARLFFQFSCLSQIIFSQVLVARIFFFQNRDIYTPPRIKKGLCLIYDHILYGDCKWIFPLYLCMYVYMYVHESV